MSQKNKAHSDFHKCFPECQLLYPEHSLLYFQYSRNSSLVLLSQLPTHPEEKECTVCFNHRKCDQSNLCSFPAYEIIQMRFEDKAQRPQVKMGCSLCLPLELFGTVTSAVLCKQGHSECTSVLCARPSNFCTQWAHPEPP